MESNIRTFVLNLVAIFSFVLYAIGIYIQVEIQGIRWGNAVVNFSIQVLGPLFGVVIVVLVGAAILMISYFITRLHAINVFLCWFWIISLYQCAVNSFLQFNNIPDEPINQFFKYLFPSLWYPVKEISFIIVSFLLTFLWLKKVSKRDFSRFDVIFICCLSATMVFATLYSQIELINVF
ncbi:MAG: hypothetical protein ACTSWN_07365 [Promethearchaeota archaeon]